MSSLEISALNVDNDNFDAERLAHYAEKDEVTRAYIEGIPIIALCGKIWIPSRDPLKYPLCQRCKEIFDSFQ